MIGSIIVCTNYKLAEYLGFGSTPVPSKSNHKIGSDTDQNSIRCSVMCPQANLLASQECSCPSNMTPGQVGVREERRDKYNVECGRTRRQIFVCAEKRSAQTMV